MNSLQSWVNYVVNLDASGHLPTFAAGATLSVAGSDGAYINGMKDNDRGFVTLQVAEEYRAKAKAEGNDKQKAWAAKMPTKFTIKDAATASNAAALGLSAQDVFSVNCNTGFAHGFWQFSPGTEKQTWCPEAFVATPPTKIGRAYDQGPTIPAYGSFGPSVSVADLPALFAKAYEFAATWPPGDAGSVSFDGPNAVV